MRTFALERIQTLGVRDDHFEPRARAGAICEFAWRAQGRLTTLVIAAASRTSDAGRRVS